MNKKNADNELVGNDANTPTIDLPHLALLEAGRIVIIGLGGIGGHLVRSVVRFVATWTLLACRVVIVDGDAFEERNRQRMDVPEIGNKATVLSNLLNRQLGRANLSIRPVDAYVTEDNVEAIIQEHDIVLAALDNHASRRIIGRHCESLDDVVLVSGGNDGIEGDQRGSYGNVQVYQRVDGRELGPPLERYHPEIQEPSDEVPGDPSCVDLSATVAPQLGFTNEFASAVMAATFLKLLATKDREAIYHEACFDILEAKLVPHWMETVGAANESNPPQ